MFRSLPARRIETVPLSLSNAAVLAENVIVETDSPPFHQSAMDGYAFNFKVWDKVSPLKVVAAVPAGKVFSGKVNRNCAVRIFTGAVLPADTDTVVIKERVREMDEMICVMDPDIKKGANVRRKGSQIKKGRIALRKGHSLTPAALAYLALLGVDKVQVYARPGVSIIITGNELTKPGRKRKGGGVYECNSFALTAALERMHIVPRLVTYCRDHPDEIIGAVKKSLKHTDILIITGGVSVGDYDFVAESLEKCSVLKRFHGVRQKPGKPLYFGTKGDKLIFALPGNPAAVLTCFYTFIAKAICELTAVNYFPCRSLPAMNAYTRKGNLTLVLRALTHAQGVEILKDQESYKLNSFANADCLVIVPPDCRQIMPGDPLHVWMIHK